ncbi:MAG TPA: YciI family protein [Devosia sp.]|nr:YciI family protein [Devosia sp.]
MQFVIVGDDGEGALEKRKAARPDHLAYWKDQGARFLAAGPFVDGAGVPTGSLIVIEADSREQAEQLAAGDPYVTRGIFARHTVRGWNWLFGRPE